jgi:hypothetical protein
LLDQGDVQLLQRRQEADTFGLGPTLIDIDDPPHLVAEAGALALTPDLPYTFDFRHNAQGLSDLVARLRAGCPLGAPVDRWLAT